VSWYDSVLSNTVGVVYRAASGNVDPWTLANIQEQQAADIAQALGPNASPADIAAAQKNSAAAIDNYLTGIDANPNQAGLRLPGLGVVGSAQFLANIEKVIYGVLILGAIAGGFYLYQQYGSIVKKTFAKR
jgi:hypothetical protein